MVCTGNEVGWAQNVWYCWDVPNWLTLLVEVIVAGALAVLFYYLSNKYIKEIRASKKEKRNNAFAILTHHVLVISLELKQLEKNCEQTKEAQFESLSQKEKDAFAGYCEPSLEQMEKQIHLYGESLEAKELEHFQGYIRLVQLLPYTKNLVHMLERLHQIDELGRKILRITGASPDK